MVGPSLRRIEKNKTPTKTDSRTYEGQRKTNTLESRIRRSAIETDSSDGKCYYHSLVVRCVAVVVVLFMMI